jgi:hypothetical protein
MEAKWNDIDYVNVNLMLGVNQMLNFVLRAQENSCLQKGTNKVEPIEMVRDYSLTECLQMGMPNWFIHKYLDISVRTVNREAIKLGLDRRGSDYRSITKYRDIRRY